MSIRALALALLATSPIWSAPALAQSSFDKMGFVRGLRDRFIAKPYEKKPSRIQRYQVWGGGRNFVAIVDDDGDFATGDWNSEAALQTRLTTVLDEYYSTQSNTAQFVAVFSAFEVPFPGAFYLPLSNDTRGLGYQHQGGPETYDSTPRSPLDGLIVMNDYRIWDEFGGVGNVFNQELGHRWGAFVHFKKEGDTTDKDDLLGRDLAHWSFFMDTGGSPMEGNAWRVNADTSFTSMTHQSAWPYAPIDLYLMGLVPAADVPPFFYIDQPDLSSLGSAARRINRSSSPLYHQQITIAGAKTMITIDDIIRSEGARNPDSTRSPKNFKIGFVLMVKRSQQNDRALFEEFDGVLDDIKSGWERATGNRATLEIVSTGPEAPPLKNLGEQCEGIYECNTDQSTACIPPKLDTSLGKFCAKRCSASNPCPEGFCCGGADLVGSPTYCFATSLNVCSAAPDAGTVADGGSTDGGVVADGGPSDGGASQGGGSGGCAIADDGQTLPTLALVFFVLALVAFVRRRVRD